MLVCVDAAEFGAASVVPDHRQYLLESLPSCGDSRPTEYDRNLYCHSCQ